MKLAVNPTRMELLKLRRRIAIAKRGHKLLRDKQDELMRKFLAIIEKTKRLRLEIESGLKEIFKDFIRARSINSGDFIDIEVKSQKTPLEVIEKKERFLNLHLPDFEIVKMPEFPRYSFFATSSDLDKALLNFEKILPKMIDLAKLELGIKLLAEEIKKTRRRVNALEYIFIPNLLDTVSYITMKLAELERSNLTRLMRVKEMIETR